MADENPTRNEINLIFKTLMNIPTNKSCFDCKTKNPTWSSVTYGVLICIDCAAVHRSLGVHLTFVRSTQLDDNWSWQQLRQMQLGGNANAQSFFETHDCRTTDAQQKYNSRAAQLYREKLSNAAKIAIKKYGRSLHLDPAAQDSNDSKDKKDEEVDFFAEHSNNNFGGFESSQFRSSQTINSSALTKQSQLQNDGGGRISSAAKLSGSKQSDDVTNAALKGPSIDALFSPTAQQPDLNRKPTIGTRKPQTKRSALGAKKSGLGAERVKANFAEIEREAELADQLKMQESEKKTVSAELNKEEEEAQLASMRLAYQDLSIKQKKEEDKLKAVDPKKAQQIERLGMGFASRSGVSHSAISDMKTIEQEAPAGAGKGKRSSMMDADADNYFDDFNFVTTSSTGFSMYKSNQNSPSTERDSQSLESMMFLDHYNSCTTAPSSSNSSSSTTTSSRQHANRMSSGGGGGGGGGWWEPSSERLGGGSSSSHQHHQQQMDNHNNINAASSSSSGGGRGAARGGDTSAAAAGSGSSSEAAQKKFGSAKAISSKQYFGESDDTAWERKSNLSRFEGSTSISSADYFGRQETLGGGGAGGSLQTPDLDDVRESVRQGVTKVAGRLSSMANGFMSSLSEKYSGY